MMKLKDFTYQEIYGKLKNQESFVFQATRDEIGFDNIEKDLTSTDFDIPFRLPLLNSLDNIVELLARDSIGQINIDLKDRIKIMTEIFGGILFYQRIDKEGKNWKVMIIFPTQINTNKI